MSKVIYDVTIEVTPMGALVVKFGNGKITDETLMDLNKELEYTNRMSSSITRVDLGGYGVNGKGVPSIDDANKILGVFGLELVKEVAHEPGYTLNGEWIPSPYDIEYVKEVKFKE